MGWGERVEHSEMIAACYTPFSDQLLPGAFLPHGIMSMPGAFVAGFAVSLLANKVYDLVKKILPGLNYQPDQKGILHLWQLGMRAVLHVVVGGTMGFLFGLVFSGSGVTAATGVAVGVAAFIGPHLGRLIYKVYFLFFGVTEFDKFEKIILKVSKKHILFYMLNKVLFIALEDSLYDIDHCVRHKIFKAFKNDDKKLISQVSVGDTLKFGHHTLQITNTNITKINKVFEAARKVFPTVKKCMEVCNESTIHAFASQNIHIDPKDREFKLVNTTAKDFWVKIQDKDKLNLIYRFIRDCIFFAENKNLLIFLDEKESLNKISEEEIKFINAFLSSAYRKLGCKGRRAMGTNLLDAICQSYQYNFF